MVRMSQTTCELPQAQHLGKVADALVLRNCAGSTSLRRQAILCKCRNLDSPRCPDVREYAIRSASPGGKNEIEEAVEIATAVCLDVMKKRVGGPQTQFLDKAPAIISEKEAGTEKRRQPEPFAGSGGAGTSAHMHKIEMHATVDGGNKMYEGAGPLYTEKEKEKEVSQEMGETARVSSKNEAQRVIR